MGWFEKAKSAFAAKRTVYIYADMMSGRTPIYSAFGQDIYASDVVTQATRCITDEIIKLAPTHVVRKGADVVPAGAGDSLQRVLNAPNHYMTTADFLSKVMYSYFAKANSWVIPTYRTDAQGRRTYTGLYPVDPQGVDWLEDEQGRLHVRLRFADKANSSMVLPYSDVIHLRRDYGASEYMGGGVNGLPDDSSLLRTLDINHQMLQGISKAMKASQAVNGVAKFGSVLDKEKGEAAMQEFEAKLQNSESGIIVMDMRGEYIPITRDIKLVDADTLKFIDEKILRHFGVPLDVLAGDYNKETYEAFYQKTIEPIIVKFSQEFTRVLFTQTERSYSNEVKFYPKELIFMSIDQTINMINLLAPTGALFENEKRVAFGMRPLAELEGKRYMSLNWIDAANADKYQVGKDDKSGQDDDQAGDQHDGGAENE